MTSILEQFQIAHDPAQDQTSERLLSGAQDFVRPRVKPAIEPQFLQFEPLQSAQNTKSLFVSSEWQSSEPSQSRRTLEKDKLLSFAGELDADQRDSLNSNITAFEKRARSSKLSAQQVESTFGQVRRIMEIRSDNLTKKQLLNIAQQVMAMAADPLSIDQGVHDTCGAAVVQVRAFMRHPEKAAGLIADVISTGKVFTPKGLGVPIDLTPHDTSKLDSPKPGQRSHASEIFQVAAVNMALNNRAEVLEGSLSYKQNDRRPETIDTGERVIDRSVFPPRDSKFAGLFVSDVLSMNKLVTGEDDPDLVLWHAKDKTGARFGRPFTSEADLQEALFEAKRDGRLPAVLYVYSGNEPLWQDAPNNADGGRGSWHFINVTDIQPGSPPKVEFDSTWIRRADHVSPSGKALSLSDLYLATLSPRQAESALKQRVDGDRKAGKNDTANQVALARQQWINNSITTDGYEQSLKELMLHSGFRWRNDAKTGKLDTDEKERSASKLMEAVDRLPYANKMRTLESLKNSGIIEEKEYNSALVATANEMAEHRMMKNFAGELSDEDEARFKTAADEFSKQVKARPAADRRDIEEQVKRGQNADSSGFFASRASERRQRRKL